MKLIQVRDQHEIDTILAACFVFEVPSNIEVILHEMRIDGQTVGYIATEDYRTVGGVHMYVGEGFRNKSYLSRVEWICKNVYFPLMKELGKEFLISNCDETDAGTKRFLKACGFTIKKLVTAELKL